MAKKKAKSDPKVQQRTELNRELAQFKAGWEKRLVEWQARLDRGGKLPREVEHMLIGWGNFGFAQAKLWTEQAMQAFTRQFESDCAQWEKPAAASEALDLAELAEQQYALGAWEVVGERESRAMSDLQLDQFKLSWKQYTEEAAMTRASESPRVRVAAKLLGAEYLGMEFSRRKREAWAQGFWREVSRRLKEKEDQQRIALEALAEGRVVGCKKLVEQDYRFTPGHKGNETRIGKTGAKSDRVDHLRLQTLYEYARESHKVRCLLAVHLIKRENPRSLQVSDEKGVWKVVEPASFRGLTEYDMQETIGRWWFVLRELADELVGNVPFAQVEPHRVERAIWRTARAADGTLQRIERRIEDEISGYFWYHGPVSLGNSIERADATDLASYVSSDAQTGEPAPNRYGQEGSGRRRLWLKGDSNEEYGEAMVVCINWRDHADEELVDSFRQFLARHRPRRKFPEPKPRKRQGRPEVNQREHWEALDNLAALRLLSDCGKEDEAHQKFRGIKANPLRRDHFKQMAMEARKTFTQLFPLGEEPLHRWSDG